MLCWTMAQFNDLLLIRPHLLTLVASSRNGKVWQQAMRRHAFIHSLINFNSHTAVVVLFANIRAQGDQKDCVKHKGEAVNTERATLSWRTCSFICIFGLKVMQQIVQKNRYWCEKILNVRMLKLLKAVRPLMSQIFGFNRDNKNRGQRWLSNLWR